MSVREIYETAFDSTVNLQQDADYLDDLVQSPLIQGYGSISTPGSGHTSSETSIKFGKYHERNHRITNSMEALRSLTTAEIHRGETRHVNTARTPTSQCRTLYRSGLSLTPTTVSQSLNENVNRRFTVEDSLQASTLKNTYRPNSDPLDRRKTDPNYKWPLENSVSSKNPVFQMTAEATTTPTIATTATTTSSEQYASKSNTTKTFSPSTEFKKLEVGGDDKEEEKREGGEKKEKEEEKKTIKDTPPQLPRKVRKSESVEEGLFLKPKAMSVWAKDYNRTDKHTPKAERPKTIGGLIELDGRCTRDDMKRQHSQTSAARLKLSLDLSQPSKRPRHHLLDFWTPGNDAFHRMTDPTVELEKQDWYHGYISHKDAENVLKMRKEGSFLVRCCQKSENSYSLSLKSANGVMHIKIAHTSSGRYVLKQQNHSFETIPELILHFSVHSLPVYGLERILLKYPVISQLL